MIDFFYLHIILMDACVERNKYTKVLHCEIGQNMDRNDLHDLCLLFLFYDIMFFLQRTTKPIRISFGHQAHLNGFFVLFSSFTHAFCNRHYA